MRLSTEHNEALKMIKQSVSTLCRTHLPYDLELNIDGLLGITVDKKEVFLVNISETFLKGGAAGKRLSLNRVGPFVSPSSNEQDMGSDEEGGEEEPRTQAARPVRKKRRGRPPKKLQSPAPEQQAGSRRMPKKRPGRKPSSSSSRRLQESGHQENSDTVPKAKRRPGRPRKQINNIEHHQEKNSAGSFEEQADAMNTDVQTASAADSGLISVEDTMNLNVGSATFQNEVPEHYLDLESIVVKEEVQDVGYTISGDQIGLLPPGETLPMSMELKDENIFHHGAQVASDPAKADTCASTSYTADHDMQTGKPVPILIVARPVIKRGRPSNKAMGERQPRLTCAERQKRYRERMKLLNPEKYARYREKERIRKRAGYPLTPELKERNKILGRIRMQKYRDRQKALKMNAAQY